MLIHATCVAVDGVGLLLRGPSGAGKSDLALRMIMAHGARLVADDCCLVEWVGERLTVRAPPTIAGLMEARGIGLVQPPSLESAPLGAVVDLVPAAQVERLPDPEKLTILGCALPLRRLHAFENSAPLKLLLLARLAAQPNAADSDDPIVWR